MDLRPFFPSLLCAAALLSSCAQDPEYEAWKQRQAAGSQGVNPYSATQPVNNAYGVPSSSQGNAYTPLPDPPQSASYTDESSYSPPVSKSRSSYTVSKGDTLWSISRQYNTSVQAIQSANGLSSNLIRTGQTLVIPSN